MKVRELMAKLQNCEPEATAWVEFLDDAEIKGVAVVDVKIDKLKMPTLLVSFLDGSEKVR